MAQQLQLQLHKTLTIFKYKQALFLFPFLMAFLAASLFIQPDAVAQDNQSLELGEDSEPATNTGPVTTITIPLLHNFNNPADNVFTDFFPLTEVTITINNLTDNGNWLYGYSQETATTADGAGNYPPVVMGWEVNPDPTGDGEDGDASGAANGIVVPFTNLTESIFQDDGEGDNANIFAPIGTDPENLTQADVEGMEPMYSSTRDTNEDNPAVNVGDPFDPNDPEILTIGEGISFFNNRGVFLSAAFEGLRDAGEPYFVTENGDDVGNDVYLADVEITFERPVDNPVLHFFGLGGFWELETGDITADDDGPVADFKMINVGTVEFVLDSHVSESFTGLEVLTSNPLRDENEEIVGNALQVVDFNGSPRIINGWNIPDVIDSFFGGEDGTGVANGSVLVDGTGIESITLQMYVRAANDIDDFRFLFDVDNPFTACDGFDYCLAGTNEFGWGGGVNGFEFTDNGETWTFDIPEYNIAHDLIMMSVSTDVDPDETTLTEGDSYRMLSSPVAGATYNDLIGAFWTQGGDLANGYDTEFGETNIFRWPLGIADDESGDLWESNFDLDSSIPNGHGFLMTVFDDDEYGVESDPPFPKTISVTGSEPELPFSIVATGDDSDGWMLLGNPMKDPLSISDFLQGATGTEDVVYVWDRGTEAAPDKGWRYSGTLPGGVSEDDDDILGSIQNGVLMPFQGFFIQRNDDTSVAVFNDGMRSIGAEGTFYRKELPQNVLSFSVTGEKLGNTLHLTFSENGSDERLTNDGLELASYNENYVHLGTKKSDGILLTLAHFPVPTEKFEMPITVESTLPGNYTLSVEDFNLSLSADLYFIDTIEDVSIKLDQNFSYSFIIEQTAKSKPSSPSAAMLNGPKKATAEFGDRFLITTQPREAESTLPDAVALNQNYPNPFNPTTKITYELPQQTDVRLTVYDMIGRQVATLVNETVQAGVHNVSFDASNLSSGVYIYRLQTGSTTLSKKLTVVK